MHARHTQARARASNWILVRRAPSANIGINLLLLLLLPHKNQLLLPHKSFCCCCCCCCCHSAREPIVSSHAHTPPARNSAPIFTSPTTLIVAALVISRKRPGARGMISDSTWWGWRRKVYTLPGAAWSKGLDILPGSRAQRALTLDFRLWSGKSAHPKTCDLQTPQRTVLIFRCCSCLCAQIRHALKTSW